MRALRYTLLMPAGKTIHHEVKGLADTLRQRSLPPDAAHGATAAMIERRWEFTGLKPRPNEPGAPAAVELYPYLHLSTFKTWEELGKWYAGFIKERFTLEAGDNIPRGTNVLEPVEEGFDSLQRNLDDEVHADLLSLATAAFRAVLMARDTQRGRWVGQNAQRREWRPRGFQQGAVVGASAFF